jgi:hypothetical protein
MTRGFGVTVCINFSVAQHTSQESRGGLHFYPTGRKNRLGKAPNCLKPSLTRRKIRRACPEPVEGAGERALRYEASPRSSCHSRGTCPDEGGKREPRLGNRQLVHTCEPIAARSAMDCGSLLPLSGLEACFRTFKRQQAGERQSGSKLPQSKRGGPPNHHLFPRGTSLANVGRGNPRWAATLRKRDRSARTYKPTRATCG